MSGQLRVPIAADLRDPVKRVNPVIDVLGIKWFYRVKIIKKTILLRAPGPKR